MQRPFFSQSPKRVGDELSTSAGVVVSLACDVSVSSSEELTLGLVMESLTFWQIFGTIKLKYNLNSGRHPGAKCIIIIERLF